jgi:hypothetical protein
MSNAERQRRFIQRLKERADRKEIDELRAKCKALELENTKLKMLLAGTPHDLVSVAQTNTQKTHASVWQAASRAAKARGRKRVTPEEGRRLQQPWAKESAERKAKPRRELAEAEKAAKVAMAAAHPDKGGNANDFARAHTAYKKAQKKRADHDREQEEIARSIAPKQAKAARK